MNYRRTHSLFNNVEQASRWTRYLYILILILVLIGTGWTFQAAYWPADRNNQEGIVFTVEKGEGLQEIGSHLKAEGFIDSTLVFETYTFLKGIRTNLQAGRYELTKAMSMAVIIDKLVLGDVIREKITVVEGWNLRDIAWHFENRGMFMAEEILEISGFPAVNYYQVEDLPPLKDFSDDFVFLMGKPGSVSLEGYLFPDTYEIKPEEGVEEILKKMLANFDQKITDEIEEKIALQDKTLFQILTMASLLEREVQTAEDAAIVAGILWKRLAQGWPLQVDATLTYLTGKDSMTLTAEDLEIDSRYNTYKYYGLPLGPICNPGFKTIKAAIDYEESPYWFYLTTPEGETIFSKTLEEHNANKAKYLKNND